MSAQPSARDAAATHSESDFGALPSRNAGWGSEQELQPLDVNQLQSLVDALSSSSTYFASSFNKRLNALTFKVSPDQRGDLIHLRFDPPQLEIDISASARPHIRARVADLAPFLGYSASRVTHSGMLQADFRDRGSAGRLSFSGAAHTLLVPDPCFWSSAAYRAERICFASAPPWNERMSKVLWRGSTTGQPRRNWRDLPRARLCLIAQNAPAELGLDAGFTGLVQLAPEAELEIEASGYLRPPVPSSTYGDYKLHIDIDGNSNAWSGLFLKLLSGGLVLKVESESDSQWYYPSLQPWRHFIPVNTCMDNLDEVIRWAIAHPNAAARIASEGQRFAESLTLAEGAAHGVAVIEAALAKKLKPSPSLAP